MSKIIECVPNISEGRNLDVIGQIVDAVKNTDGVTVADYSYDNNHNRSVITFFGTPEGVENAAVALAKKAVELIDMRNHNGAHPRMGAVDVIPFIPIKNTTMDECVELSRRVGQRIWQEAKLPSFLYEASSTDPARANLAEIRKGEFEGMPQKLCLPEWAPDYGTRAIHPTAGIVAIGARMPLVAFNINLSTSDISIAKKIAAVIRRSSGGFDGIKALGVMLDNKNIAQVTINVTNYMKTPLYRVLELTKTEAARWGVHVINTEIVGLAPMRAIADCAEYYMQLSNFNTASQIIENNIIENQIV